MTTDKNLFMVKYGPMHEVKDIARNHADYHMRQAAVNRLDKECPYDDDYESIVKDHLTKTFQSGNRTITSINLDHPFLTGEHLDIIASKFDEKDPRNQQLFKRMRNKVKYKKDLE